MTDFYEILARGWCIFKGSAPKSGSSTRNSTELVQKSRNPADVVLVDVTCTCVSASLPIGPFIFCRPRVVLIRRRVIAVALWAHMDISTMPYIFPLLE